MYPEPPEQQEAETNPQHKETSSNDHEVVHRSERVRRAPIKHKDYLPHEEIAFEDLRMQDRFDDLNHPIVAMKSTSDSDTMYLCKEGRRLLQLR